MIAGLTKGETFKPNVTGYRILGLSSFFDKNVF